MITKEKNRTKIICAVVTAISAIVAGGSAFQLHNVQNISQTVNGNVIQILGETGSYVSAGTDLTDSTDELISAYRKVLDENSQYQANQYMFNEYPQLLSQTNLSAEKVSNQIKEIRRTIAHGYAYYYDFKNDRSSKYLMILLDKLIRCMSLKLIEFSNDDISNFMPFYP